MTGTESITQFSQEGATLRVLILSQPGLLDVGRPKSRVAMLERILEQCGEETKTVILDLGSIERVNSAVLGLFVQLSKELDARHVGFGVANVKSAIVKVMKLTRLTHFLVQED